MGRYYCQESLTKHDNNSISLDSKKKKKKTTKDIVPIGHIILFILNSFINKSISKWFINLLIDFQLHLEIPLLIKEFRIKVKRYKI